MVYVFTCILIFLIVEYLFRKIEIKGKENVPKKSGFIVASNHVSYFDPPVVGYAVWRASRLVLNFIAKSELGKTKFLRWFFKHFNVVFIRRGESDRKSLEKALDLLHKGENIIIFPEGSSRPECKRISTGVGFLAIKSEKQILPVKIEISGYHREEGFLHFMIMTLKWFLGPGKISIKFGPILDNYSKIKDRKQITRLVMTKIYSL